MRNLRQISHGLICAVLLFVCLPGCSRDPVQTDLLLPIDFSNVPDNMVLTQFNTDKIEIRIQAIPKLIELINTESTRYPVDLYTDLEFDPAGDSDSIEPGAYLIPVEEKRIPMNPTIRILNINPPYIRVQLERKIKKRFSITVPYIGTASQGYIVLEAATTPSTVELSGAASQINGIVNLMTKPVDLSNAKESFKKEIPLDLDNLQVTCTTNPVVVVEVPIQEKLLTKTIDDIPIAAINCPYNAYIEPPNISIAIKGPFETLGNKSVMGQIYSFVDLEGLSPGVYVRHAYINIPVNLMMTDASPQVFTIKIEE